MVVVMVVQVSRPVRAFRAIRHVFTSIVTVIEMMVIRPFIAMFPFAVIFEAKRAAIAHALFDIGEFVRPIPMAQHALNQQRSDIHNDQKRENEQPEFSRRGRAR